MAKPPPAAGDAPPPPPSHPPTLTPGDERERALRETQSMGRPITHVGAAHGRASARHVDPRRDAK